MCMLEFYCDQLTAYLTDPNIVYIESVYVERLVVVYMWWPA